jgi:hypothetical protein
MGDMAEIFGLYGEIKKREREQRKTRFVGQLVGIGAEPKADGVWQYKDYFLYPTKGFAMNRYTYAKKPLEKLLKEILK